jgi:hypothetical protein
MRFVLLTEPFGRFETRGRLTIYVIEQQLVADGNDVYSGHACSLIAVCNLAISSLRTCSSL